MNYVVLFAAGFAPGVFWLWYFYSRDRFEPEPKKLIAQTFGIGMLLGIPATIMELVFVESLAASVLVAPVIEEGLKYAGVRLTVYRSQEFDEPLDGIVYAAAIALGFASLENAIYLVATYLGATDPEQPLQAMSPFSAVASVFAIRAVLSVPSHVLFSSLWGSALGHAKFSDPHHGRKLIRIGLFLAIFTHGVFNLLASYLPHGALGILLLIAGLWVVVHRKIREAHRSSPHPRKGSV